MASLASAGASFEPKGPSSFARVLLVFTSPARAFAGLGARGWWLPYLLLIVVGLGYSAAIGARVGWGTVARTNLANSPKQQAQMEKASSAQQEASLATIARVTRWSAYAFAVAGPLLFGAIVEGVLLGTLRVLFGGKGTFGIMFAAYQYAALPAALKGLLVIATLFAGVSGDAFQLNNPLGSNPAYYLQGSGLSRGIVSLLTWVDVFVVWQVVLLATGAAAATGVARKSCALVVAGWTSLFALLGAGLALLG